MKRPNTKQSGNTLIVMMFVVIMVTGLMSVFLNRTVAGFRSQRMQREAQQAVWEAGGQLQIARNVANHSSYDMWGENLVLQQNADTGQPIPGTNVYLTSVAGSNNWYEMRCTATMGSAVKTVRMMVRGRDTFARFGIFVGDHPVGLAYTTIGDVHTNRYLEIFFPGAIFKGNVSAHEGFVYVMGADPDNAQFLGEVNPSAEEIDMPPVGELEPYATGVYHSNTVDDVKIELRGDKVWIKVENCGEGEYLLPESGIIYVKGRITQLSGTLNGRLTIASGESVNMTGSIRYVDDDGDTAYLNGLDENSDYVENPDYDGGSALGIVADDDIEIPKSAPDTRIEINAAMYSRDGHIGISGYQMNSSGTYLSGYDSSYHKESVRYLGAMICKTRPVDQVVAGENWVVSGFNHSTFVYDSRLLQSPPPHFLTFERPQYKGWEILD